MSNLKRDLGDLTTKRKKELGYPITPLAERRREEESKKYAYDENAVIESPEPLLSSPTKGKNLASELKMLNTDDTKWEEKNPTVRGKLVVRHTKKTLGLHRMNDKKNAKAVNAKKYVKKKDKEIPTFGYKRLESFEQQSILPPKTFHARAN